jgi:glycosyltransferase involved in cell wall biosynthesis
MMMKKMKKVLILTYYWPPGGGAGVQRCLKFVKYLREFGYEPIVYTSLNGEMPVIDNSLMRDIPEGVRVLKTPIWEPYNLYKSFIGQGKDEKINAAFLTEKKKPSLTQKVSVWLRGNIFIPDARKFWIKPSVKYLTHYLKDNPVDIIFSSGPPHTMHLIAYHLKKKFNIPWVADFRDPWTNIDYYKDLMLSPAADKKHHRLEQLVVTTADKVVVIGETMKTEFETLSGRKVDVIYNGFDTDDIDNSAGIKRDEKFSLAHIGTLVKTRNPMVLWKTLSELVANDKGFADDLLIKLVGKVDFSVRESLKEYELEKYVQYTEYLPHGEIGGVQKASQVLLLLLNNTPNAKGILTGKFFEYLASERPILCIGLTDGDAAKIIDNTKAGYTIGFEDSVSMKKTILRLYDDYKNGSLIVNSQNINQYSRRNLTHQLADLMNKTLI